MVTSIYFTEHLLLSSYSDLPPLKKPRNEAEVQTVQVLDDDRYYGYVKCTKYNCHIIVIHHLQKKMYAMMQKMAISQMMKI